MKDQTAKQKLLNDLERYRKIKEGCLGVDYWDPKLQATYRRFRLYLDKMITLVEDAAVS